jgi:O-antigen/teichoic acid export membrane protein
MDSKFKGSIALGISSLLFLVSGYLTNIWLGRNLGPSMYGIYGVLISLMTAMNIMQISGVPQAVSKFSAEKHNNPEDVLKSGLQVQLCLTLMIGLVFFLSAPIISIIFHDNRFLWYVREASLIFPVYGIFALFSGYYNGIRNFHRQAIINIAYSISKVVLVILFAAAFSLYGAILGFILSPFIALLFGLNFPKSSSYFPRRRIILYSLPLIGFAVLTTLQLSVDLFSLKALTSDSKLSGYYTVAQNIEIIPLFGLGVIGQVILPNVSHELSLGKIESSRIMIKNSLRLLLILLLPITTMLFVTASNIIQILFGTSYLEATRPLKILLIGYIFLTIFTLLASILNGAGRAKISMVISGIGLALSILSCLILIPRYGMAGAATGSLIGSVISSLSALAYTLYTFKVSIPLFRLARILLGALAIFIAGALTSVPLLLLPAEYLMLCVLYITVLMLVGEISKHDRAYIKRITSTWVPFKGGG